MEAVKHQLPTVLGLSKRTKEDKAEAQRKDKQTHALLRSLRARSRANKECADCTAPLTGWASLPHGVFLCIDCAQVHRNLGRHMAQVKAFSTGTYLWYDDEVDCMRVMGNANANRLYASPARGAPRKPDKNAGRAEKELYIRAKYEKLKWVDPYFALGDSGVSSEAIATEQAGADAPATARRGILAKPAKRKNPLQPQPLRKGKLNSKGGAKKLVAAATAIRSTLSDDLWGDWAGDSSSSSSHSGCGTGAACHGRTKASAAVPAWSLLDKKNTQSRVPCLQPTPVAAAPAPARLRASVGRAAHGRGGSTTSHDFFAEFGL